MVDHGDGAVTLHAHLAAEYVTVGQRLDQGQLIGRAGTSGGSTGPHLHYEQREGSGVARPPFGDTVFTMPTTQASANCAHTPVAGDWNDDGVDDLAVFRRGVTPSLRLRGCRRCASVSGTPTRWSGDWDGDGRAEVGVFRPSTAAFLLRAADGRVTQQVLGSIGSLPVTGDWNGDKITDLAVYDQGTWTLAVRGMTPVTRTVVLGDADDLPVTGDWDGDGDTDPGCGTPPPRRGRCGWRHVARPGSARRPPRSSDALASGAAAASRRRHVRTSSPRRPRRGPGRTRPRDPSAP